MEKLIGVDWEPLLEGVGKRSSEVKAVLLTLTYPSAFSASWEDWKRDLEVLRKRIKRNWPIDFAIWKEEFQERGAPHFHILIVFRGVVNLAAFRQWVSLAWYEIVGSEDPKHLAAGTNVRAMYGPVQRLLRYLMKYLAKVVESPEATGRIWGVWGKIPYEVIARFNLRGRSCVQLGRRVRKWGKKSRYLRRLRRPRFLIFGDGAALAALMRGLDTE